MRFSSDMQIALLALVLSSCLSLWSVAELISRERNVLEISMPFVKGTGEYLLVHELGCLGRLKSQFNAGQNPELKFDAHVSVLENKKVEKLLIEAELVFNSDKELQKALINLGFQGKNNKVQIQVHEHEQSLKLQLSMPKKPALHIILGNRPQLELQESPKLIYEYASFLEQATLSFTQNLVSEKMAVQIVANKRKNAGCPVMSQHLLNMEDIFPSLKKLRKGLLRQNQISLET